MGTAADDITEGIVCLTCGEFVGAAVGYPRLCDGCAGDEDAPKKIPQDRREFQECAKRAATLGLDLRMHSPWHLTLRPRTQDGGNWLLHIYPGKRRAMWDRDRPPKLFRQPIEWSLDAIVTEGHRVCCEYAKKHATQ